MCVQGSGWTALFFAAKAGKSDVFRELLCRGAVTETSSVSLYRKFPFSVGQLDKNIGANSTLILVLTPFLALYEMPLLQDKVENVAHMCGHEELLLDLGKYKKVSEWKEVQLLLCMDQYKYTCSRSIFFGIFLMQSEQRRKTNEDMTKLLVRQYNNFVREPAAVVGK